jgi:hypothetical protein
MDTAQNPFGTIHFAHGAVIIEGEFNVASIRYGVEVLRQKGYTPLQGDLFDGYIGSEDVQRLNLPVNKGLVETEGARLVVIYSTPEIKGTGVMLWTKNLVGGLQFLYRDQEYATL